MGALRQGREVGNGREVGDGGESCLTEESLYLGTPGQLNLASLQTFLIKLYSLKLAPDYFLNLGCGQLLFSAIYILLNPYVRLLH